jgi:hypothetical protein
VPPCSGPQPRRWVPRSLLSTHGTPVLDIPERQGQVAGHLHLSRLLGADPPPAALLQEATEAVLVVVGSRGLGEFRDRRRGRCPRMWPPTLAALPCPVRPICVLGLSTAARGDCGSGTQSGSDPMVVVAVSVTIVRQSPGRITGCLQQQFSVAGPIAVLPSDHRARVHRSAYSATARSTSPRPRDERFGLS